MSPSYADSIDKLVGNNSFHWELNTRWLKLKCDTIVSAFSWGHNSENI
ncbi:hypothetical protein L917_14245 [Phytophthora nicotianae]|uniref:Uncharacterized protein n=1 Tax=Phytophthora nicotianae TaxID=4792 RepID=W2KPN3_PHYNI|nr:hypothetical protein L917_14245 [Phytophthora nicotianae]